MYRGGNTLIDRSAVMHVGFANGITLWGLLTATVRGSYIYQSDHSGINVAHWLMPNIVWLTPPAANVSIVNNVIDGTITTVGDIAGIHTRWAGIQTLAMTAGVVP
jgi:hypothetical protein